GVAGDPRGARPARQRGGAGRGRAQRLVRGGGVGMRILYGVQGTGNGHITRARAMAPELARAGIAVDYLFSGRPRERLFDMEPFGDFQHRDGLTFAVREGRIDPFATLRECRPLNFIRDIRALDLDGYDLVLSDY